MVEIALLFLFLLFCLKHSSKQILCFIFLFLPLHGTIKTIVFQSGGEWFSMWKELGLLIILVKERNSIFRSYSSIWRTYFFLCLCTLAYFGFGSIHGYYGSSTLKKLLFPCLLTLCVATINLNKNDIKRLFFCILVGSFIINITGLLDFLSPSIRSIFRHLMNVEFSVSKDGTVFYDINSFTIMGYERVCGLMSGGPNQFGIFNAGIIFIGIISILYCNTIFKLKKDKILIGISLCMSSLCLLLSFSRAGMAIVLLSLLIMSLTDRKLRSKIIFIMSIITCALIIGIMYSTQVEEIILATLTGKEASSAARYSMTNNALDFLLNHPLGYGLGATSGDKSIYFAESSLINFGIEIGVIGLFLLLLLILHIYKSIRNNKSNKTRRGCCAFLIAYVMTSLVSVNTYENPFIYYAWLIFGFGLMKTGYFTFINTYNYDKD